MNCRSQLSSAKHRACALQTKRAGTSSLSLVFLKVVTKFATMLAMMITIMLGGCVSTFESPFTNTDEAQEQSAKQDQNQDQKQAQTNPQNNKISELQTADSPELMHARQLRVAPVAYPQNRRSNSFRQRALLLEALEAYQQSDFTLASTLIEKAENDANNTGGTLNSAAYVLKGDVLKAETLQALKADTSAGNAVSNPDGNNPLGLQQALKAYEKALSINPDNYRAANRAAMLHREFGQFEQSLERYNQALRANPAHAPSYRNRAVLNDLYIGNKAAAYEDYQIYTQLLLLEQERASAAGSATDKSNENIQNSAIISELNKEIKLAERWLMDLERQIQALARNSNSQRSDSDD
uniref:tetratricopeptide repeat protein n=1 Tax=Ningiella ruwaisensis TaxID=2364274 RepID=UPI00109EFD89|nr:tetratricopeptide repeat protein [Ningiella ruwaisensis]